MTNDLQTQLDQANERLAMLQDDLHAFVTIATVNRDIIPDSLNFLRQKALKNLTATDDAVKAWLQENYTPNEEHMAVVNSLARATVELNQLKAELEDADKNLNWMAEGVAKDEALGMQRTKIAALESEYREIREEMRIENQRLHNEINKLESQKGLLEQRCHTIAINASRKIEDIKQKRRFKEEEDGMKITALESQNALLVEALKNAVEWDYTKEAEDTLANTAQAAKERDAKMIAEAVKGVKELCDRTITAGFTQYDDHGRGECYLAELILEALASVKEQTDEA